MAKARDIPGLDGAMTYGDAAARTVEVRAQEIFDHEDGVLDIDEIERVHAMRVATRRLRAVLEIYEPCFPRKALRPVLAEVKELADALGARRDPDVELLALEQFAASVGPDERAGVQIFIDRTRIGAGRGQRAARRGARGGPADGSARTAGRAGQSSRAVHVPGRRPRAADRRCESESEPEHEQDPVFQPHELGDHPHGLGRLSGPAPASPNQDTGW